MRASCRLVVVLSTVLAAQASAMDLVREGKPAATIIVGPGASPTIRFAAEELQSILHQVSGARLPISAELPKDPGGLVLLGTDAASVAGKDVVEAANVAEVQGDGYAVTPLPQHKPPCLVIASKEPRGVLYAVYDLLERYVGCGFFPDGDLLPKSRSVAVMDAALVGQPAHRVRLCHVDTRFYGPKGFQATLWNVGDWKQFLRWMARRKYNCLAVNFTASSRSWGTAFDRAFPETRPHKQETLAPRGGARQPTITSRMGWGLHPKHTTQVMQQALRFAREQLGLKTLYVCAYGQFEGSLQAAHPDLSWLAPPATAWEGNAGQNAWLAATDAKCQEFQTRLWESVVKTFGAADYYLLFCRPDLETTPPWVPSAIQQAIQALKKVDPDGTVTLSTAERDVWGETAQERLAFLGKLPTGTSIFYQTTRAPDVSPLHAARFDPRDHRRRAYSGIPARTAHAGVPSVVQEEIRSLPDYLPSLVIAFEYFAGRPYWYGCAWGGGPSHDLLENRYDILYYHNLHRLYTPATRRAQGFCNWALLRGVNPLMDHLCGQFAWHGENVWRSEGASDNRFTRHYLARRYGVEDVAGFRPASLALKAAIRGAPLGTAATNYRAYAAWAQADIVGLDSCRQAVAAMLEFKEAGQASPFYERDLVDLGRNYLHQLIASRYGDILVLVESAKTAAKAGSYAGQDRTQNLGKLKALDAEITRAHAALIRLLATREDLSLDAAILEATKTQGANRRLAQAIREHQSGTYADAFTLVDSLEYHQQVKAPQIRLFLDYAKKELTSPTNKAVPPWRHFFLHGTQEFIERAEPVPYDQKAEKAAPSDILAEFLKAAP